ncbi:MAG: ABC transporter ATP-binding protein [Mycobacteriales bacterium]
MASDDGQANAFAVDRLTRRYGDVVANNEISLTVGRGEIFGLLGPNGAGKSTLVRQLVGLLRPDSGSVRVFGRDLAAERGLAARATAYLAQEEPALDDMDVTTAVELTGRLRGAPKAQARQAATLLLEEVGLGELAKRTVGKLSGGQRRLVGVATALVGDRPILVLDEPTTGLDPVARRAVWSAIEKRRASGTTIVLVTHNVLEAETVLDRVAVLEAGRVIACDSPGRLKAELSADVRLDIVWRGDPPLDDAAVAELAARSVQIGRRWSARLPVDLARETLGRLTAGPAFEAIDDFSLAPPSLEDVYLALGGSADDLERA